MAAPPQITVVVLNYNGAPWIERCLESLRDQSIFGKMEVIVADNRSGDGSDRVAEKILSGWPNAKFIQHGENLGFCEGNNRAARHAQGKWIFFLNNDTWLERECLAALLHEVESAGAQAATPLILNYADDTFQSLGATGFDIFGFTSTRRRFDHTRETFMPEGCAYVIERRIFEELGGFDPALFMFSDELDLSWRLWIAGHKAVAVPVARLHHRSAANVNPKGAGAIVEFRTSDTKRFYANRNALLVLLKNAGSALLVLVPLQLGMLAMEALLALLLIRRWTFVRRAYIEAIEDCWRLRQHVLSERRRVRQLRRRSDWWMLRFLRWRLNRWDEVLRSARFGRPKVTED